MKRILITGGSGFLGSRCVRYFHNRYVVYAPGHKEMDITDWNSVISCVEAFHPGVILHCAAVSDVGRCEKEPQLSWDINVTGSVNMAKAAAIIKAKCILCSSDQVYFGSDQEGTHREDEILKPFNLYGREKLTAEQECQKINPDCVFLRLSWMYDTKTLHAGEHGDFMRNFMSNWNTGNELSYPIYDVRGISDVNEVIHNIDKTFEIPGGVYNFGSPNDKNMYETMLAVFDNLGLDISRISKNEQAFRGNPRNISMCQTKPEGCGIVFSSTEENLTRCIGKCLMM